MVMTESCPPSRALAKRNSNFRTLLPERSLEVKSSLLIHISRPKSVNTEVRW
jgi:hypothetical protein